MSVTLHLGDCLDVLRSMPGDSVDSCVCDPPYGLNFMGKAWDRGVPSEEVWGEVLRVLKPGGHLLAFAGTRTQHRMACAIEDAGFEIRDMIAWIYGSGFPKSHDVAKGIDKMRGAAGAVTPKGAPVKRMIPGADQNATGSWIKDNGREYQPGTYEAATDEASEWSGWGTALKPALEPITVARKPLAGTVTENVLSHGAGALNIDGCRVPSDGGIAREGRWPANLIHDGSAEVLELFPESKGQAGSVGHQHGARVSVNTYGDYGPRPLAEPRGDTGSAARFFYCAKATKADRDDGLKELLERPPAAAEFRPNHAEKAAQGEDGNPYGRWQPRKNIHPTVKPTDLMRYLCRLVTPPGGTVLDPFMGSGSTGRGAVLEGFGFIGVEIDTENGYLEIARLRIEAAQVQREKETRQGDLFDARHTGGTTFHGRGL